MRAMIIDDRHEDAERLAAWLREYGEQWSMPIAVDTASTSQDLGLVRAESLGRDVDGLVFADPRRAESCREYNVLLIDIFLDGEPAGHALGAGRAATGMEVAKALRAAGVSTPIVFTTMSADYAVEGYAYASGYLVKPYSRDALFSTLDRVLSPDETVVSIPVDRRINETVGTNASERHFQAASVVSLQSRGHYLDVTMDDGHVIRLRSSMRAAETTLLKDGRFIRVSRGVIVNLDHVLDISAKGAAMTSGATMPVSRRELPKARRAYHDRGFGRLEGGIG